MIVVVDTSVLIDFLRGRPEALELLENERLSAPLHASEITRLETLAGMRTAEETRTMLLLGTLVWHPVDTMVAEKAGELGRQWLRSHSNIDGADLAVAATVLLTEARLLTRNVRHFPMIPDLQTPY